MQYSEAVRALLADLRQHPAFPLLLKAVEAPPLRRFRPSKAEQVESERAQWIYDSGRNAQHDQWLFFLTGKEENNIE